MLGYEGPLGRGFGDSELYGFSAGEHSVLCDEGHGDVDPAVVPLGLGQAPHAGGGVVDDFGVWGPGLGGAYLGGGGHVYLAGGHGYEGTCRDRLGAGGHVGVHWGFGVDEHLHYFVHGGEVAAVCVQDHHEGGAPGLGLCEGLLDQRDGGAVYGAV